MSYIEINHISKSIKGNLVLNDINLSLEKGKIYGFIGKNGSGKTMLFRAITGLIYVDSGSVVIDGKKIGKDISFAENTGLLIENVGLWEHLTAFENLKLISNLSKKKISDEQIKETISAFGLDPSSNKSFKKFSLGMKQRLCLAQAFLDKPKLLILDEPTNALDDDGTSDVLQLLVNEKEKGNTVLVASHDKEWLQEICDETFKLYEGKLVGD